MLWIFFFARDLMDVTIRLKSLLTPAYIYILIISFSEVKKVARNNYYLLVLHFRNEKQIDDFTIKIQNYKTKTTLK